MEHFIITPKVDETQEFIEIANDFSDPLDLVREAISNSYDASATEIEIIFEVILEYGDPLLKITLVDNGSGMTKDSLRNFFDLGNSSKRNDKNTIGEKGHGTKVFFNSRNIFVTSSNGEETYKAVVDEPFKKLHNRQIPTVDVTKIETVPSGTKIEIYGYNRSRREKFTHAILKDYIKWFTKHGAIEKEFKDIRPVKLKLKGIDRSEIELIDQGHHFPSDSVRIEKLLDEHMAKAPDFYSKKIVKKGVLKNSPEITFDAVFCIEGKHVKYSYNEMLRRPGYSAPEGAYTIQDRYGLYICKDYIPILRKNDWITFKGSEYTKFHAFINCQGLRLTANRGSIDNTPSEILKDLKDEVLKIYEDIIKSDDWTSMEWLEDEASAYQTIEKEKKHFDWRIKKINKANVATHKGVRLVEPERESGVFSLFLILAQLEPTLFPFHVVDYDTHEGIDVIAKGDKTTPISSAKLFYVEFKKTLSKGFNHSFENIHSVICWDTDIKHDDYSKDINGEERRMQILPPEGDGDYTRYYLDNPRKAHKIEVYCLKTYLKQKLGIDFNPRTADDVV